VVQCWSIGASGAAAAITAAARRLQGIGSGHLSGHQYIAIVIGLVSVARVGLLAIPRTLPKTLEELQQLALRLAPSCSPVGDRPLELGRMDPLVRLAQPLERLGLLESLAPGLTTPPQGFRPLEPVAPAVQPVGLLPFQFTSFRARAARLQAIRWPDGWSTAPTEAVEIFVVAHLTGFEPASSSSQNWCSRGGRSTQIVPSVLATRRCPDNRASVAKLSKRALATPVCRLSYRCMTMILPEMIDLQ
jgi:hypothetical protein